MENWNQVRDELAAALPSIPLNGYLGLFSTAHQNCWAQFLNWGEQGFRAECVADHWRPENEHLGDEGRDKMIDRGWLPPRREGDHFFREWPSPPPYDEVAAMATTALGEVYGAQPTSLEYEAQVGDKLIVIPNFELPMKERRRWTGWAGMTVEELRTLVRDCLREITGNPQLEPDQHGEFLYKSGSAAFYVRVMNGGSLRVEVLAPLIWDIGDPPDILDAVNHINSVTRIGRVFWTEQKIMMATTVCPAQLFSFGWLHYACTEIGALADHFDDELRSRFGGSSPKAGNEPENPGYL